MPGNVLRSLVKEELQAKLSLENITEFLGSFQADRDKGVVDLRLKKLDEVYEKFCEVRVNIEVLLDDTDDQVEDAAKDGASAAALKAAAEARNLENVKTFKDFENKYFELKAALLAKKPKDNPVVTEPPQPAAGACQLSRTKYPELRLPTFSGKLLDWVNFRDNFKSLIHDNRQLNPMDKFNYLRTSLKDDALLQINQIQVCSTNYALAWSTLETKYENHKLIAQEHLKALFAVAPMKSESFPALNNVLTTFRVNLQQLAKLGENTDNWSTLLAFLLSQKLDDDTLRHWETHHSSKNIPSYTAMMEFLENHCAVLQSTMTRRNPEIKKPFRNSMSHAATVSGSCSICNGAPHSLDKCQRFGKMKVIDRKQEFRRLGLCLNCLLSGHYVSECSRPGCSKCGQRHHYLLHPYSPNPVSQAQSTNQPSSQKHFKRPQAANSLVQQSDTNQTQSRMNNTQPIPQTIQAPSTSTQHAPPPPPTNTAPTIHHTATPFKPSRWSNNTLLSTAVVKLADRHGNTVLARALLDNGSQICLVTENISQKLHFKRLRENLPVKGVGGSLSIAKQSILATVHSCNSSFATSELKFFVLPRITSDLPVQTIDISSWKLPSSICLADPTFNESRAVDILLGVSVFYELLLNEQMKLSTSGPILCNTELGWIVTGEIPEASNASVNAVVSTAVSTEEVFEQVAKFWEIESCRTKSCLSIEESACESIFKETTTRDADGRFRVALPKKEYMLDRLGDSKSIATKRFLVLEKRLNANLEMKELYTAFIHEYLLMGHMRPVDEREEEPRLVYYMPHHAVLKPDSTTTKLRVVFDASCPTNTGVSLNDVLMVGPVVQDDLLSILLRFRINKYAIVGDVEKMYRMVNVHESDQPLQRILWRDSAEEPIRSYQLTTVTYGTSSAPFLATRCLKKCGEDGEERSPAAAAIVTKSFYVDDMLGGAQTVEEGVKLCTEVLELLQDSGFNLRKLNSNHPEILKRLPSYLKDDRELLDIDATSTVKTLGLIWEPATDLFWFKVPYWRAKGPITQRIVLSDAARLFDPYGLVGPVVVQAKLFLQDLWKAKCSWDEPLSEELQSRWLEFRENLAQIDAISVPRWVDFNKDVISCEYVGFCDASEKAYGAAVYLRCTTKDGKVSVHLVMAKSKVAPLEDLSRRKKKQTIPRLELSAALLLAHLYETVSNSLQIPAKAYFWTDSTIVKCWLSSHPSRWQMFVANRVSEIQHLTRGGVWSHVPGIENPADVISRGLTPLQLAECSLWWNGPAWLYQDSSCWPHATQGDPLFDSVLLEEKPLVTATLQILPPARIFTLRSTLLSVVTSTALVQRYIFNSQPKNRAHRKLGILTPKDYDEALLALVRLAQSECYPLEISDLTAKSEVRPYSKLNSLHPVMIEGLLCVGGRLANAPISHGRRHPMILDSHHPLTKLIMVDYHHRLLHGGVQLMISCIRERFWPVNAKSLAKRVVHECVRCFRAKPRVHEQLMGDLPLERVSPAPPFLRVGVDYCGPFDIQYPGRKGTRVRCFICVFVCLVCKAVHVEMVADLTTEAFLAALRRFSSRRGTPQLILCDNATNFVGARRELCQLHRLFRAEQFQDGVSMEAARNAIEFKFIPARSPNFGGLWEAAVKSLKSHMRRIIGLTILHPDEMLTVVVQIEACLNSRPLTPISSDPTDMEALTPGHFLVQRPLTAIPEPDLQLIPTNRLSRWQQVQQFSQLIWKRWSTDYLSQLQNRNKWTRTRDNLRVGTMVLLKEDNLPPLKWKLEGFRRVSERDFEDLHPSHSGQSTRRRGGSVAAFIVKSTSLLYNRKLFRPHWGTVGT